MDLERAEFGPGALQLGQAFDRPVMLDGRLERADGAGQQAPVAQPDLRRDFAAIVIACGAKRSRALPIPNADAIGVMGGVDFLRDVALGKKVELGQRVIVIGGGNVAYDVARTVLRQEEYDVSRTAARMAGVREVNLACLESLEEMPADTVEILEGQEEGVNRHNSWGPKEILVREVNGQKFVRGVRFVRCLRVYDENKRFAPQFDESITTEIEGDNVPPTNLGPRHEGGEVDQRARKPVQFRDDDGRCGRVQLGGVITTTHQPQFRILQVLSCECQVGNYDLGFLAASK